MLLDGLTLIQKTADIFADEEKCEQGPADQIRHPTDWLGTHGLRIIDYEIGSGNTQQIYALTVVALMIVELTIVVAYASRTRASNSQSSGDVEFRVRQDSSHKIPRLGFAAYRLNSHETRYFSAGS